MSSPSTPAALSGTDPLLVKAAATAAGSPKPTARAKRPRSRSPSPSASADADNAPAATSPNPKRKARAAVSSSGGAVATAAMKRSGARASDVVRGIDETLTKQPSGLPSTAAVLTTFNVNGLRAAVKNGIFALLSRSGRRPDAIAFQEVKGTAAQFKGIPEAFRNLGYSIKFNSGTVAGYAGTALATRTDSALGAPLKVVFDDSLAPPFDPSSPAIAPAEDVTAATATAAAAGLTGESAPLEDPAVLTAAAAAAAASVAITQEQHDEVWRLNSDEGRVITAEWPGFYWVSCYTPNSGDKLERLDFRATAWEPVMREYLYRLRKNGKAVLWGGDLNVAHGAIDLNSPGTNHASKGFTDEERGAFEALVSAPPAPADGGATSSGSSGGFCDAFRLAHGPRRRGYTFWGYRFGARAKNLGWRLDYCLVSGAAAASKAVLGAWVVDERVGDARVSDHAPLSVAIDLSKFGMGASAAPNDQVKSKEGANDDAIIIE